MTELEIKENLCWFDPRNPNYPEGEERRDDCHCDNCFYGRDKLANEILKEQAKYQELFEEFDWYRYQKSGGI